MEVEAVITKRERTQVDVHPKAAWMAIRKHILDKYDLPPMTVTKLQGVHVKLGTNERMGGHNDDIEFVPVKAELQEHLKRNVCVFNLIEAMRVIDLELRAN